MNWEMVIGIEVHAQLMTQSKLFSGAPNQFNTDPNNIACEIDLGLPGVLPVLNRQAVHQAITFGLITGAKINKRSVFARKNYFYPDLPKGYQISQFEDPIIGAGHLDIVDADGQKKAIRITRAHLEEDAGKSIHSKQYNATHVDLNRAGMPLLEIVSEPDIRSRHEASAYLKTLHHLLRYMGICDGNMQEGSFRADINISHRRVGEKALGTRTEIKNLNSFRFINQAIALESERQVDVLESGGQIEQHTLLYDPDKNQLQVMRTKEDAHDYRYFPDPDLLPVHIDDAQIEDIKHTLPEHPKTRNERWVKALTLNAEQRKSLLETRQLADYFDEALLIFGLEHAQLLANSILGDLMALLNKHKQTINQCPISPMSLAELCQALQSGTLSKRMGKEVLEALWAEEGSVKDIISNRGLEQVSDSGELKTMIEDILSEHPEQVAQYQSGKEKMIGFFVGKVMQQTQGRANPKIVNELLKDALIKS